MSDAFAQVFTPAGELLGYTVYQGSADLVHPKISAEFTWDAPWVSCDDKGDPCIVWEDYGGGCWFESHYCPEHGCLTGELSQWGDPLSGAGGLGLDKIRERRDNHPFPDKRRTDLHGSISEPNPKHPSDTEA